MRTLTASLADPPAVDVYAQRTLGGGSVGIQSEILGRWRCGDERFAVPQKSCYVAKR